jgi:alkyl hydroperoxide reductase subunit AhpF
MGFLSPQDQQEIRNLFDRLSGDVKLVYFTQRESPIFIPGEECETCKDTRLLLEEVTELSDKLSLEVHDFVADSEVARQYDVDRIPALVMTGDAVKGRIRYFGMPAGHEFSVLLGSLIDASTGQTEVADETRQILDEIKTDIHIQVFVTPT